MSMPPSKELQVLTLEARQPGRAWLNQVAVSPRLRRSGLARSLWELGKGWAAERGRPRSGSIPPSPRPTSWTSTPRGASSTAAPSTGRARRTTAPWWSVTRHRDRWRPGSDRYPLAGGRGRPWRSSPSGALILERDSARHGAV